MKITINTPIKEATEKPFPKFMQSDNGIIVYFTEYGEGLEIIDSDGEKTGDCFAQNWAMDDFQDLPDSFSITLTNTNGD